MIVVTGAYGFIGSRLVHGLNGRNLSDILVVDTLKNGRRFENLVDAQIRHVMTPDDFLLALHQEELPAIRAVFHQGACSDTTEWDGDFMLKNNYEFSCALLHHCMEEHIPFIYASSAAVYGHASAFSEDPQNERPLNVYGYSKLLFDRYVRRLWAQGQIKSPVVGLRYFNVYGPAEHFKERMASVAWHFYTQLQQGDRIKLFGASHGVDAGEQRRDFVYVDDIVDVNLWFYDHPEISGIYNVGTGQARSFNDLARAVIQEMGRGMIEYIPFPGDLKGAYQSFTEADLTHLRKAGCDLTFTSLEEGVHRYFAFLKRRAETL